MSATEIPVVEPPLRERFSPGNALRRLARGELGSIRVLLGIAVIWTIFQLSNDRFLSAVNLSNLTLQIAAVGTISIGVVLILLLGEIDLSVGAVSGLAAATMAVISVKEGLAPELAIVAGLLVGTAIGLFNGFMVTFFGIPSFVVTLAGLLGWQGAQLSVLGDTGSVNLGGTGADGLPSQPGYVYTNSFSDVAHKMRVCSERGLGPSVAVFEPGFLRVVVAYHRAGALPAGTLVKFYFSAGGYLGGGQPLWGAPPIAEALDLYCAMLGDTGIPWAVAVLGGSLLDTPVARLALERGGHLRVGIEDWDAGPPNAEQIAAAATLCAEVGRSVATIEEADDILFG